MTARKDIINPQDEEATWYKDAVIYELHVKTFCDSNGDGIGDFKGLTEKLDYLQDLGVTALWLLPFYPSPLKDDGYDIAEYTSVNPSYGSIRDFRRFMREAHKRGLKVITELVMNHTSDQHKWFRQSRRAKPGTKKRDFYVWSDTPDRYREARIIFKDFETSNWTWDPVAKAYYWHRFYSHQPDLNYDNPAVTRAIFQAMEFWLDMGVDGMRIDAVPYLFEREGTNCENLKETHDYLKQLRAHVERKFKNRMFLAEANQWPEDAAAYFGEGDECHMNFHFPLMPRLFMSLRMEDRTPIIDILEQTPEIHETCQWATFLRNHDELTLEMVTDEERDYMYRMYAHDKQMRINLGIRRRLAPLLGNNRRSIELLNGLLFSLLGTPVLYYGDELGMGDNIYLGDRNGVRTPMQWSSDRNAGFSKANAQRLYLPVVIDPEYHYESVNVEAQQGNPHSLLWFMKHIIMLRKSHKAFSRGTLEFLHPENRTVLTFVRRYDGETILVVANLSRYVQCVRLDLSEFKGRQPVEMFGQTEFPPIGDLPYFLTLSPHAFYWFTLDPISDTAALAPTIQSRDDLPAVEIAGAWSNLFAKRALGRLEKLLPRYLRGCRWFSAKSQKIKSVSVLDAVALRGSSPRAHILLIQVDYRSAESEMYWMPVALAVGASRIDELLQFLPQEAIVGLIKSDGREALLYDAIWENEFCSQLLDNMARGRRLKGTGGEVVPTTSRIFRKSYKSLEQPPAPSVMRAEQSNSSIVFGEDYILKLFRQGEVGVNPDVEIGRFLTDDAGMEHIPRVFGSLDYVRDGQEPMTLGILQDYIVNEGDAWKYTLDQVRNYFAEALTRSETEQPVPPNKHALQLCNVKPPLLIDDMIGHYLGIAQLLGKRTGELHLALASDDETPDFAPEAYTPFVQRSLYQSLRNLLARVFGQLRKTRRDLPDEIRTIGETVLERQGEIQDRFREIINRKLSACRMRIHGDFHLGQVLYAGGDFYIMDFEGEPARTITERRIKTSPLRDVAGMLRSFHYASSFALMEQMRGGGIRAEDYDLLQPWAEVWHTYVGAQYLCSYLQTTQGAPFLPDNDEELRVMLDTFLLEKVIYELGYELNNRPLWLHIPVRGILGLLEDGR